MRIRVDPDLLPIDPDFPRDRLGAVRPARLSIDGIRDALSRPYPPGLHPGDGLLFPGATRARAAAVLIGLIERAQGLHVLLTVRAAHLRDHAGQISFPGGAADPHDADAGATAIREAQEELAIAPDDIRVLGCLPAYATVSGFHVIPVVGAIAAGTPCHPAAGEVQECFDVPLAFLMDDANLERRLAPVARGSRPVFVINHHVGSTRYRIWGATAAMLRNLHLVLMAADAPIQSALRGS